MVTIYRSHGSRVDDCYEWPDLAPSMVDCPLSTAKKIGLHSD